MTEASLDDFAGTLVLVGAGKMGGAMLEGWHRLGLKFDKVAVIEPQPTPEIMALGQRGLRINPALDTIAAAAIVIAVKPQSAPQALPALKPMIRHDTVAISIMAGRTLAFLENALPGAALVRAMPNTPALVRSGVTAISGGSFATSHDLRWAEDILSAVGTVVRLPERLLDAVTGLSGSGPAYFFLVAEALMEAGVQMGLTRDVSRTLVVETMLGSARLLEETGQDPEALRAMVTSPAGTTAAGVRALEAKAVRSAFMEAVAAATERSRTLHR